MLTPLLLATMHGGYTNFIKLLLKAGPDPNIPDDVRVLYILLIFADLVCRISLYCVKLIVVLLFSSSDNVKHPFSDGFRLLGVIDYAYGSCDCVY